jgi:hypothetical protein
LPIINSFLVNIKIGIKAAQMKGHWCSIKSRATVMIDGRSAFYRMICNDLPHPDPLRVRVGYLALLLNQRQENLLIRRIRRIWRRKFHAEAADFFTVQLHTGVHAYDITVDEGVIVGSIHTSCIYIG